MFAVASGTDPVKPEAEPWPAGERKQPRRPTMSTLTSGAPLETRARPSATPTRTAEREERELRILWRNRGDEAARAALVRRFLPLARHLARRYERSSESFDDLLQVASLGLLKAIDRFDPDRGAAFVSFAVPTILGEIRRYFRDCCWDVHVPRGTQERTLKVEEAQRKLTGDRGRAPSVAELAEYLELDREQVLDALSAAQAYPRTSPGGEKVATYAEMIGDVDTRFSLVDEGVTIGRALKHLSERERLILALRFGEDLTQSEIAERIGVSQMQVSRLLRRALDQLRILTRADEPDPPA
jgi:RNA polymerase sigma-B factor